MAVADGPRIRFLAKDVLLLVMSMLDRRALRQASLVCVLWRRIIHGDLRLVEHMYSSEGAMGWEGVGVPGFMLPEPLLRWLTVNKWMRTPLPLQRAVTAPLALGIDAVLQCQPLSGITTSAVIAALWKAAVSRLPQHLSVICHYDSLPSTADCVRRIVDALPSCDNETGTKIKILRRGTQERMGLKFNDGTLVLKSVRTGKAAHQSGATRFVGKRLTHVNGSEVSTLDQVARIVANKKLINLRFEGRGFAEGIWWDDRRLKCGGRVAGVPFTVSVTAVDEKDGNYITPGSAPLTLRFRDETGSKKRKTAWCMYFIERFKRRDKDKGEDTESLLEEELCGESEITIKRFPKERLGIKFMDGSLVIKSVNPSLKAHSHGVWKFKGRRLTHVNGIPVSTLKEVKEVVHHKPTFVTVEQSEKVAMTATRFVDMDEMVKPVAVFTGSEEFDCPVELSTPIRGKVPSAASHFFHVSERLVDQLQFLEAVMSAIIVPSMLVVCADYQLAQQVAEVIGAVPISQVTPSPDEHLFTASPTTLSFAPRVALVVFLCTPLAIPKSALTTGASRAGVPCCPGATITFSHSSTHALHDGFLSPPPSELKTVDIKAVLGPCVEPPQLVGCRNADL